MDIYCNESMPSSPELERKKIKYSHELYNNNNNDKNVKTKEYTNPSELLCYLQLLGMCSHVSFCLCESFNDV